MGARGQLRNHALKLGVKLELGGDDVGLDAGLVDDRGRRVVAGRLYADDVDELILPWA
jgi:hypothetical protein